MAVRKREITGTFYYPDGSTANGAVLRVELTKNDYSTVSGFEGMVVRQEFSLTLDGSGVIVTGATAQFWCNSDGNLGSHYKVTEPNGDIWFFDLAYGDASIIDITTLKLAGTPQVQTEPIYDYIDSRLGTYVSGFADLPTAVASIGGDSVCLKINTAESISEDLTIPDNILVEFCDDGMITVTSGFTCTIHNLSAPTQKVFDGVGDVIVDKNSSPFIDLTWWAGKTNAGDVTHELEQAIVSAGNNAGCRVRIPSGTWKTTGGRYNRATSVYTNGLRLFNNTILEGDGNDPATSRSSVIELTDTHADAFAIGFYGASEDGLIRQCAIKDVGIKLPSTTGVGILVQGQAPDSGFGVRVENVSFVDGEIGVAVLDHFDALDWEIQHVTIRNCTFSNQHAQCVYGDCVNGSLTIEQSNFGIKAGKVALEFLHVGITLIRNNNFGGASAVAYSGSYGGSDTRLPDGTTTAHACLKLTGSHVAITYEGNQDESVEYTLVNDASDYTSPINFIGNLVQGFMQINESVLFNSVGNTYGALAFRDSATAIVRVNSINDYIQNARVHEYFVTDPISWTANCKTTASSATIGVPNATAALISASDRVIFRSVQGDMRFIEVEVDTIGASDSHSSGFANVALQDRVGSSPYDIDTTNASTSATFFSYERQLADFVGSSYFTLDASYKDIAEVMHATSHRFIIDPLLSAVEEASDPIVAIGGGDVGGAGKHVLRVGKTGSDNRFANWYDLLRNATTGYLQWVASQVGTAFAGYSFDAPILNEQATVALADTEPSPLDMDGGSVFALTGATGNRTINASNIPASSKREIVIIVDTDTETTDRTITFGTGFESEGTLATGTTAQRKFVFKFITEGGGLVEVSRTAAQS